MNRLQRRVMAVAAIAVIAVLAAAAGTSGAAGDRSGENIRGQSITVLVPYKIPADVIASFTKATGVKVNYVVTGWDATHAKLVVANTARTYIADVAEFDWWGEFNYPYQIANFTLGATGWMFWFKVNTLSGSYVALTRARRS